MVCLIRVYDHVLSQKLEVPQVQGLFRKSEYQGANQDSSSLSTTNQKKTFPWYVIRSFPWEGTLYVTFIGDEVRLPYLKQQNI